MILKNIKSDSRLGKFLFWWGWGPLSLLIMLIFLAIIAAV